MVRNREKEREFLIVLTALRKNRDAGHYLQESGSFQFGEANIDSAVVIHLALMMVPWNLGFIG